MDNSALIKVLSDWNFWEKTPETGIERASYLSLLKACLDAGQVVVITGARRSGKSYLMRQVVKQLLLTGLEKKNTLIVNLEDPRLPALGTALLERIFETYQEFLRPSETPFVFLDEVQEVPEWEKWVRMMHELKKARIVVSGSNAQLLSREWASLLTGRHLNLTVLPLSFREFLTFNGLSLGGSLSDFSKETQIRGLFREYLEFGGFPEVTLQQRKTELLLTYLEDVLRRDIAQRNRVRKRESLNSLARYYFSNLSHLSTFSSLEKALDISADTIESYSGYFEAAYLLFFLKRFSWKVKEQEKSPRKVYSVDVGLGNIVGFHFSRNLGAIAENLVFLKLKSLKMANANLELYYWKDPRGAEVDFLVKDGRKVSQLIQVCWQMENLQTRKRELSSLIKAMHEMGISDGMVLTEEQEGEEQNAAGRVLYVPLWKWLLSE